MSPCRCGVICAALLFALTASWPAGAAQQRATLEVSARVVERCAVTVPRHVRHRTWRHLRRHVHALLTHKCSVDRPFHVRAERGLRAHLHSAIKSIWSRKIADSGVVVVTVTY